MSIELTSEQYISLLAAAEGDSTVDVAAIRAAVNATNGISAYTLRVRWYETGGSAPKAFDIHSGTSWPPEQQLKLTMSRPITRDDVDQVLTTSGINPVDPMVTQDILGLLGWTILADYDF